MAVLGDTDAIRASPAGRGGWAAGAVEAYAIQRPRDDPGGGGLAHSADPGQHEGMSEPAGVDRIGQGAHHGLLPDQLLETGRTVFAGQHAIGSVGLGFGGHGFR